MEPKARIKSGLIAVALGLTTTFSPVGGPFSLLGNSVFAQEWNPQASQTAAYQPVMAQSSQVESAQKLLQARKALATRDLATAERLLGEVASLGLTYQEGEDRPEAVQVLIQRFKNLAQAQQASGVTEQFRRDFALFALQQADMLLRYGDVHLATQLTQAAAAQNVIYNQDDINRGMEPAVMMKRIDDVRLVQSTMAAPAVRLEGNPAEGLSMAAQRQLNDAISFTRQARQALMQGDVARADQLCKHALANNLPETVFPANEETPHRLMAEIAAARQNMPALNAAPTAVPAALQGLVAGNATNAAYNPANGAAIQQVRDGQPAMIDQALQQRQAVMAQVSAQIMQQVADANRLTREERNPQEGLELLGRIRQDVESSTQLDAETKQNYLGYIDHAVRETQSFTERYQSQLDLEAANRAAMDNQKARAENFANMEQQLKTIFEETDRLLDAGRYAEAALMAKRAREIAPNAPEANTLATTTQLIANIKMSQAIQEAKAMGYNDAMMEVDIASIPLNLTGANPMMYDEGFVDRMKKRQSTEQMQLGARLESEREIIRRLEMPVSLNLTQDVPLREVLDMLKALTGVQIVVDEIALSEVDIATDKLVRLPLTSEIRFKSVLNLLLKPLNLTYVVEDEVLKVTSTNRARGKLIEKVYYVGDLVMPIPNFNGENRYDVNNAYERAMNIAGRTNARMGTPYTSAGNAVLDPAILGQTGFSSGSSGGFSNGYNASGGYFGTPTTADGAAGGQADFTDIIELIEMVVSPDSWAGGDGGGSGEMREYMPNLTLIVRQTEEVHAEIADLLAQLRKLNDLQIAVELRYISLSDTFYEKMGVDFDMVFHNDNSAAYIGRDDRVDEEGNQVGTGSVMRGNHVVVGMDDADTLSLDLSIPMRQSSFSLVDPTFGGFDATAGINMGFALLSEIEAYFFLNASQGDSRSNVLQAPKVTLFNGQMGSVNDTSQSPFVTGMIPVVGDFAAAYQPIIVILNEGQFMNVQGTVSSDRKYVRLTLNPMFTKITKVDTFKFVSDDSETSETETTARGDDENPASSDEKSNNSRKTSRSSGVSVQLPTLATFSVNTTVSVPDGGTILLGGIKRLREGRTEAGTPILNKIPYINRLFSNAAIGRDTSSIMMLVTPRIIIQEEEEENLTGISPTT